MVTTPLKTEKRLSLQTQGIAPQTTVIRSLDWDRDRFDIEFGLQNGTTYNSYLIQADKVVLVDSSHTKFRETYLALLTGLIDPQNIDYLVISHTEPDHSGLVKDILQLNPKITVVASKVALQFLDNFVHLPFERLQVKNGDRLELGQGHVLEFVSAPNLHWPDTMLTYDHHTQILFTCDVFGMHYCSDALFDEDLSKIEPDYRFYYDCLMGPNARSVLAAMKRMDELGEIKMVANGHGPLLRHHVTELLTRYRTWSQSQAKAEKSAIVFYMADYGYSDRLSQAIARGITKTGVAVEMMDLSSAEAQEVQEAVNRSTALIVGMPPLSGEKLKEITPNMATILAAANNKQWIGLYESYGGNDEPVDPLLTKFRELGLKPAFAPIKIKQIPTENIYQLCEESGT
ncbi:MAG: FprA family A-type flavoprotein, partial [Microcystaceae cyanobacterium]